MTDRTLIALRAHTERTGKNPKDANSNEKRRSKQQHEGVAAKWPPYALVIDTETTIDDRQSLTFGTYQFCRLESAGEYVCIAEGIFYSDDLPHTDPGGYAVLQEWAKARDGIGEEDSSARFDLFSRADFMERVFWRVLLPGALLVGFNLPFDLTRLAIDCRKAKKRKETWSLVLSQDRDPQTNRLRLNPFRPRIVITPKDGKAAFIRLAGTSVRSRQTGHRFKPYVRGRFLDLRTLGWALRNKAYSLESACRDFKVAGKRDYTPTGRVSSGEIEYCFEDVRATVRLLNATKADFECHPLNLYPDQTFSPASVAKAYIKRMGVIPPSEKFNLPSWVSGAAMQAYYGGRAECRIRHTKVPIVSTDFMSEYPTANTLMGLWDMLVAEDLQIVDATAEVEQLLATVTLNDTFAQSFWKRLPFFALVRPSDSVLPVRTDYNGKNSNIGVNPLTSTEPIWYAGPDLVAAKLLTGQTPEVVRAFRLIPGGLQGGLRTVHLRGAIKINPKTDDFFKRVIEARLQIRSNQSMPKEEREDLSYFLKILANAGSYGLFVEVNPGRVGERAPVQVFSGEKEFSTSSLVVEAPGTWYFPPFAALITAAGRLLLTLLECSVRDAGGTYLFCDTDSMAIVSSESGGLVACEGGPHQLPDGRAAIKALTWDETRNIVAGFGGLNPYEGPGIPESILKIEDVNFSDGAQRALFGWAIAVKRYALFSQTSSGQFEIVTAKAHGLGFLFHPRGKGVWHSDTPTWVLEGWEWILRGTFNLPRSEPVWFDHPAMMRLAITTPNVLKALQVAQGSKPYHESVKPFNFVLMPILDPIEGFPIDADRSRFTLVGPFTSDPARWYTMKYVNIHDGKSYHLSPPNRKRNYEASAKTLGDYIHQYERHPEAKSLAPDGQACKPQTHGLLKRTPVSAYGIRYIGKETDRHWEQGEDISLVESKTIEYTCQETSKLVADPTLQSQILMVSIRALAREAGVSENTVKAARRGDRLRKTTAERLRKATTALKLRKRKTD